MLGKIALEEAFAAPWEHDKEVEAGHLYSANAEELADKITDLHGFRAEQAKKYGVGYTILSYTSPGPQDYHVRAEAEEFARKANEYIANEIKGKEDSLGAFAALSMHDPSQAAAELENCVKQYGFVGAMVNDTQKTTEDGNGRIFYDGSEWDVFWQKVVDLDVPLYIHPRAPTGWEYEQYYKDRHFLIGPPLSFANGVSPSSRIGNKWGV